jgi:hypothetical protein
MYGGIVVVGVLGVGAYLVTQNPNLIKQLRGQAGICGSCTKLALQRLSLSDNCKKIQVF